MDSVPEGSVLVVAHPDDEILWFGSVAPEVDQIVICFLHDPGHPELTDARTRVLADHPWSDRIHCLGLTETGAFDHARWPAPKTTRFGLKIVGSRKIARTYRQCARELHEALRPIVSKATHVFTHNPWGEYGHEEHVMVHRVATLLAQKAGTPVWYSNYASNWTEQLSHQYLRDPRGAMFEFEIDIA